MEHILNKQEALYGVSHQYKMIDTVIQVNQGKHYKLPLFGGGCTAVVVFEQVVPACFLIRRSL